MKQGVRLALIGLAPLFVLLICLYVFRPILLPFLVGFAGAYLLDPAADRLERLGLRRTGATVVISVGFFLALVLVLVLLLPILLMLGGGAGQGAARLPGGLAGSVCCPD